ncbi:putative ABC transport system permease protein [Rhodoblastus acidophilus]|uniref:ABC transporter permease n=1 Tax=Rhodoblastus acidophilus TaxID=1074 RepID=UPI002224B592|nr:FtsX-like permease family protein [Rhodoblastus acidophilus]MCW2285164.1 putative ABC transport system permease protein [Rhodoblastus acidophilus]MCW2334120.1 putative ABC transport system permease protein [Rhodoblastus acidophilus]
MPKLLRFALRDLRGGLRSFGVFIACIALGVMALAAVAGVSRAMRDGLANQGAAIIGGDLSLARAQGAPADEHRAFLAEKGRLSEIVTLRSMARREDSSQATLVELKSVDAAYPLVGTLQTEPQAPLATLLARREQGFGVAVDPQLGSRLKLALGDTFFIGDARFVVAAWLRREPDALGAFGFAPHVLLSPEALNASGLIKPGSLTRASLRLLLPNAGDAQVEAVKKEFSARFPDSGYEIRSRADPSPQLTRNIERFAQFITLIGLTALVCGGVGVANAVRALIDRKRKTLAILKALGASGGEASGFVLIQVLIVAFGAALLGAAAGLALPALLLTYFAQSLPFPIAPALHPFDGLYALGFGLLIALTFAAAPLQEARALPVTQLLRDTAMRTGGSSRRGLALAALGGAALIAFAVLTSGDAKLTLQFGAGVLASFGLLYGVARLVMALARRAPHVGRITLRLAVANLHRPGALTPSFLLSLGLGVTLLTALMGIEHNLRAEIGESLPKDSPNYFFIDVQKAEAEDFKKFLHAEAPDGQIASAPMLRGRITRIKGVPAEQVTPNEKARWALEGDRGITFASTLPQNSRVVAGEFWPADYRGPPLVSMEVDVARGLGLEVGDEIAVNVLGRNVTAKIANLRKVNWRSFGINFVLVFSPHVFDGAPFTALMTLSSPEKPTPAREAALLGAAAKRFPSVVGVSLRETLATLDDILGKLAIATRVAASLAFVVSALVLAGALAAGQRARLYEAVVLKTLGATREKLLSALTLEFSLLGVVTAVFGLIAGGLAAWLVTTKMLDAPFVLFPMQAALVAGGATLFAIVAGLLGTARALGEKPARWLRQE